ncbi:shikimate kinase [Siphonobacter sp. SORGH_AS_0500]|uniref:shikimate kinase n=1 Tax=Siphonobacter sp. SORGH_AS_0500 TaxID=1864824 RepID=UPI002856ECED|nr:shikimate kinase [Siphonobacter sp. SORGH_AS_0500]MDR6194085.1 shikimate kinase [Siphonobacter sp. SORGH_AS_0500]
MKNIFLLGMPSSGKSTLGRSLAREIGYEFVDMDKRIEIRELLTIAEIFNLKGEPYFRTVESEMLRSFPADAGLVVSTGGGVPCFHDNMDFIRENGVSLFLDVPPKILTDRILHTKKNDRPLLVTEDPVELLAALETKIANRRNYYEQADVTIAGETDVQTMLEILRHLQVISS